MKKPSTSSQFKSIQEAIKQSSMQDYKDWVEGRVREMEVANARNDSRFQKGLRNRESTLKEG